MGDGLELLLAERLLCTSSRAADRYDLAGGASGDIKVLVDPRR